MRAIARLVLLVILLALVPPSATLSTTLAVPSHQSNSKARFPDISATEVFVALTSATPEAEFARLLALPAAREAAADVNRSAVRTFLPAGKQTVLKVPLVAGADPMRVIMRLSQLPGITWAAPNRIYNSDPRFDPREYTPDDPRFAAQYHHQNMQTPAAWDVTEGAGVIIGILDDGIEIIHEDLQANIWQNDDPLGGGDTDGNGYIDDTNGWNVVTNTLDVKPDGTASHGTHVAGIAAARTNNTIGVAGTAGKATIMPVKFYSNEAPWTSAIVAEALRYATDNDAKIINMSYNINGFVGDPVVTAAFEYAYTSGVLLLNSAGNNDELNPVRQVFSQMLFVANTDQADLRASSSNYGTGIDIAAPGENILSTVTTAYAGNTLPNPYDTFSGTSMATPNAAGVAALIWAANPTWTRDQVAARLVGTADSIDTLNPQYAGLLGSGRINASRAVSSSLQLLPPQITVSNLPPENGNLTTAIDSFTLRFSGVLSSTSVASATISLRSDGIDNTFGTADDSIIPLTIAEGLPYQIGDNYFTLELGQVLLPERYRFTVRSGATGIQNPFGQQLDGNADGSGGDDFIRTFFVGYQLYGTVFEDWNNNAIYDTTEPFIANATLFLDLNDSGAFDTGEPSAVSTQQGLYAFSGVTPANTKLRTLNSLVPTTFAGSSANVVIGAADANTRLDIGVYYPQTVYGYAYNDEDGDGTRESGEAALTNWESYLDLNQNSTYNPVLQTNTYTNAVALAIPDESVITSTLTISNQIGFINDLDITLTISHTYLSDLRIELVDPAGQRIRLINQSGEGNIDYAGVILDDEASQPISAIVGSPATGTYRPEQPLSTFDTQSANGTWSLVVYDLVQADTGTIQRWSIKVEAGELKTQSNQAGAFKLSGVAPGNYTLRQIRPFGWRPTNPIGESYSVNIPIAGSAFGNDFGNQDVVYIYLPLILKP
jgi:subtilisin family serine protease/subtilisin-like proprotein convertase family protein